jgi:hypothetical protein
MKGANIVPESDPLPPMRARSIGKVRSTLIAPGGSAKFNPITQR